jgi:murein DD-endopeptidase MepM/ murein hydrolase activator NlpD
VTVPLLFGKSTGRHGESTGEQLGNHRADRRGPEAAGSATPITEAAPAARAAGGRRKASRRQQAANPFKRIPAAPSVLGVAALALAAAGAIGVGGGTLPGSDPLQLSANDSFSGTDAFNFAGNDPRSQAISRDSERQAAVQTADQKLQAAVEEQSQARAAALTSLAASAEARASEIAKNLWVLPTIGYVLTARFGQSSGLWAHLHTGLDFAAPTGTPIFAIADGVITFAGYDGSYGNKTVETLPDGTQIWYAHQSEIGVTVGEHVTQSEQIGRIGSTGNTTGPHVHIEVRPHGGDPVDPYPQFVEHGVTP